MCVCERESMCSSILTSEALDFSFLVSFKMTTSKLCIYFDCPLISLYFVAIEVSNKILDNLVAQHQLAPESSF